MASHPDSVVTRFHSRIFIRYVVAFLIVGTMPVFFTLAAVAIHKTGWGASDILPGVLRAGAGTSLGLAIPVYLIGVALAISEEALDRAECIALSSLAILCAAGAHSMARYF